MTTFQVWAPGAQGVKVEIDGRQVPMELVAPGGWHQVDLVVAGPGSDYRFLLDGEPPMPDPRSSWQPRGVHGRSRVLDHDAFAWTDHGWTGFNLPSAVLYELHVGTFTPRGTFDAAIEKLDHLVRLGVDAVELMPVAEFAGARGWGYDGVDLFAPHHGYGGPSGLKRLVDACHRRGLGVVMDVVCNHVGPDGNYLPRYGPYFHDRYRTPWGAAVNLDGEHCEQVRAFLVGSALGWLRDYHCDGLRVDAIHAIHDESPVHFLAELSRRVEELSTRLGRPLWLVAEGKLHDPRVTRCREAGGQGLHAQWNDDFHHALHVALTGESTGYYARFGGLASLASELRSSQGPGHHYVAYLQNHDQVGNRPRGERTSALMSPARLRVGAALVLTSPFVPMLFQGEEWGAETPFLYFTDHHPAVGRPVAEGRLRELSSFGWQPDDAADPQDPATFESSKLCWDELQDPAHEHLLDWHRRLIRLRRQLPSLAGAGLGQAEVAYDDRAGWLQMTRGAVTVACNLGPEAVVLAGGDRLLVASRPEVRLSAQALELPPDTVAIISTSPLPV